MHSVGHLSACVLSGTVFYMSGFRDLKIYNITSRYFFNSLEPAFIPHKYTLSTCYCDELNLQCQCQCLTMLMLNRNQRTLNPTETHLSIFYRVSYIFCYHFQRIKYWLKAYLEHLNGQKSMSFSTRHSVANKIVTSFSQVRGSLCSFGWLNILRKLSACKYTKFFSSKQGLFKHSAVTAKCAGHQSTTRTGLHSNQIRPDRQSPWVNKYIWSNLKV